MPKVKKLSAAIAAGKVLASAAGVIALDILRKHHEKEESHIITIQPDDGSNGEDDINVDDVEERVINAAVADSIGLAEQLEAREILVKKIEKMIESKKTGNFEPRTVDVHIKELERMRTLEGSPGSDEEVHVMEEARRHASISSRLKSMNLVPKKEFNEVSNLIGEAQTIGFEHQPEFIQLKEWFDENDAQRKQELDKKIKKILSEATDKNKTFEYKEDVGLENYVNQEGGSDEGKKVKQIIDEYKAMKQNPYEKDLSEFGALRNLQLCLQIEKDEKDPDEDSIRNASVAVKVKFGKRKLQKELEKIKEDVNYKAANAGYEFFLEEVKQTEEFNLFDVYKVVQTYITSWRTTRKKPNAPDYFPNPSELTQAYQNVLQRLDYGKKTVAYLKKKKDEREVVHLEEKNTLIENSDEIYKDEISELWEKRNAMNLEISENKKKQEAKEKDFVDQVSKFIGEAKSENKIFDINIAKQPTQAYEPGMSENAASLERERTSIETLYKTLSESTFTSDTFLTNKTTLEQYKALYNFGLKQIDLKVINLEKLGALEDAYNQKWVTDELKETFGKKHYQEIIAMAEKNPESPLIKVGSLLLPEDSKRVSTLMEQVRNLKSWREKKQKPEYFLLKNVQVDSVILPKFKAFEKSQDYYDVLMKFPGVYTEKPDGIDEGFLSDVQVTQKESELTAWKKNIKDYVSRAKNFEVDFIPIKTSHENIEVDPEKFREFAKTMKEFLILFNSLKEGVLLEKGFRDKYQKFYIYQLREFLKKDTKYIVLDRSTLNPDPEKLKDLRKEYKDEDFLYQWVPQDIKETYCNKVYNIELKIMKVDYEYNPKLVNSALCPDLRTLLNTYEEFKKFAPEFEKKPFIVGTKKLTRFRSSLDGVYKEKFLELEKRSELLKAELEKSKAELEKRSELLKTLKKVEENYFTGRNAEKNFKTSQFSELKAILEDPTKQNSKSKLDDPLTLLKKNLLVSLKILSPEIEKSKENLLRLATAAAVIKTEQKNVNTQGIQNFEREYITDKVPEWLKKKFDNHKLGHEATELATAWIENFWDDPKNDALSEQADKLKSFTKPISEDEDNPYFETLQQLAACIKLYRSLDPEKGIEICDNSRNIPKNESVLKKVQSVVESASKSNFQTITLKNEEADKLEKLLYLKFDEKRLETLVTVETGKNIAEIRTLVKQYLEITGGVFLFDQWNLADTDEKPPTTKYELLHYMLIRREQKRKQDILGELHKEIGPKKIELLAILDEAKTATDEIQVPEELSIQGRKAFYARNDTISKDYKNIYFMVNKLVEWNNEAVKVHKKYDEETDNDNPRKRFKSKNLQPFYAESNISSIVKSINEHVKVVANKTLSIENDLKRLSSFQNMLVKGHTFLDTILKAKADNNDKKEMTIILKRNDPKTKKKEPDPVVTLYTEAYLKLIEEAIGYYYPYISSSSIF